MSLWSRVTGIFHEPAWKPGASANQTGAAGGGEVKTGDAVAPPASSGLTAVVAADDSSIPHRTLLIHGYSASGTEFEAWKAALASRNIDTATIEIGNYVSLNNEITIKDLGEAFDRALRKTKWSGGSKDDSWTFDAIVHSTGMLVVRQWLVSDPFPRSSAQSRIKRLKHLVGLAPATFGSPQGKKGRSFLGALVKGSRNIGPDFMNAGDMVLDGLELGSRYTWDLSKHDMLCDPPMYDQGAETPYVAVFIGNTAYSGIAELANSPGTDGTVRWAGCALNTRLVELDFRRQTKLLSEDGTPTRAKISKWLDGRLACPMLAVAERDHGTILAKPDADVVDRVSEFLRTVNTDDGYRTWLSEAQAHSAGPQSKMDAESKDGAYGGKGWQQFVLHVKDDHGDAVTDYNVRMFVGDDMQQSNDPDFKGIPLIADTYSGDASYRCFYVRLDETMPGVGAASKAKKKVWVELIASSGTAYLEYEAYSNDASDASIDPDASVKKLSPPKPDDPRTEPANVVKLDLSSLGAQAKLFYPYTTTMVEITLEREPMPLQEVSKLFTFWQGGQTKNLPD